MQLHLQVHTQLHSNYYYIALLCTYTAVLFFYVHTGAMDVALGSAATGVFTNSDWLWERLQKVKD